MSDLDWDAEDFEPPKAAAPKPSDKWEGEDVDEDTKDNWDEDSDAEKSEKSESSTTNEAPKRKKKNLAQIIAEKEKRQQEEAERRRKLAEEALLAQTPEEKLAEKLRVQKIQEDSDLVLAEELMGTDKKDDEEEEDKALDAFELTDSSSLESFRIALVSKIRSVDRLEKKPYFVTFVEDITRDFCLNLESEEIKRVTTVLNGIYNEKVKASKPVKGKKKAANKAKLNSGQGAITDSLGNDFGYNEYDDFI
ncbi:unnamed protein product [Meganyctiphanes norvegica]|uniref:Eukaryotic translation initiation factor 3 subunit J n=1 Tax=Meganyctiphanes norvegica TaxID=48144 RepID=A0AAV2PS91_MEGNR